MFIIRTNSVVFNCIEGLTIFQSANENGLLIEHSCLTGRCSSCRAKLLEGITIAIKEEMGLSEKEKMQGYILTCVRKPTSDVVLDLDVLENVKLIKPRTIPVKINSITRVSQDVIKLVLRFPPNINFDFLAGQYTNLIKGNIKRSYSIAGTQDGNNLCFYIKKYDNGQMSNYLFFDAKENDLLRIEGPLGSFFLREHSLKNIIFIATGTGIAPILSILQNSLNSDTIQKRNIYLFHGGRFKEDLIEKEYFTRSNLNYFPVLSRENVYGYYFGYVQNVLIRQTIDFEESTVYACGLEKMIQEAKVLLTQKGLNPKEFYSDAFFESKSIDL